MHSLGLYGQPNSSTGFLTDLTHLAPDWSRSIASVGGYKLGSFSVDPSRLSRGDLIDAYNTWLGCEVREECYGQRSWEGLVSELRLTIDGASYFRSLAPEWWHNYVSLWYTSDAGKTLKLAALQNADSIAQYGRMEWLEVMSGGGAVSAVMRQAAELREKGWPRSWPGGELAFPAQDAPDGLEVTAAGFWATLNYRMYSTSVTAQAATLVGTLRAASEWVLDGRREANEMLVYIDCSTPQRLGDLIEGIISQGGPDLVERLGNGGFETAGGGGADVFADWAETAGTGTIVQTNVAGRFRSGSFACQLTAGAGSNTKVDQTITVTPGQTYVLCIWTRGDGANAGRYGVYDVTNAAYITAVTSTGVTGAAFARVYVTFTAPATCNSVMLELWCPPGGGGKWCCFDDISIQQSVLWQGGVYANRELIYEPAPLSYTYLLQGGRLTDLGNNEVTPWLMQPGVLLYNADAPSGGVPAGSASLWDDPRVAYVEEVEAATSETGDTLTLRLYGQEEDIALLEARAEHRKPKKR